MADAPLDGSDWPRISIVTPSLNQGPFIEEAIRSVLLQGYPNLEYVIIDGGSTDGSVDTIKKYERFVKTWVSEPDDGQYQALNKGISHCTGEIFNWINSDDLLCPSALFAVAAAWTREPGCIIAGPASLFSETGGERLIVPKALNTRNLVRTFDRDSTEEVGLQQGTFIPLKAVNDVGGLREGLRYVSDRILLIDVLEECKVTYISQPLGRFRFHDSSKTVAEGHAEFRLEFHRAIRNMPGLHDHVSPNEVRWEECRAFLLGAAMALKKWQCRSAARYFIGSLRVSISSTFVIVITAPPRFLAKHAKGLRYSIRTRGWRGTWRHARLRVRERWGKRGLT